MNWTEENQATITHNGDARRINRAIAYASRLLGVREYSRKMLFDKILKKGYDSSEAHQVIEYLLKNNWLDDTRFCEAFVRSKVSRGQGLLRIRYELSQKGVDSVIVDAVFKSMKTEWQEICDRVISKKLKLSNINNDLSGRQKIERFLRYRGFSSEEIRHSIEKYLSKSGVTTGEYDE